MKPYKMQKIEQPILRLPQVNSMGVIGDPGCEGLGTYNMKVYAGTLEKSSEDDITYNGPQDPDHGFQKHREHGIIRKT